MSGKPVARGKRHHQHNHAPSTCYIGWHTRINDQSCSFRQRSDKVLQRVIVTEQMLEVDVVGLVARKRTEDSQNVTVRRTQNEHLS